MAWDGAEEQAKEIRAGIRHAKNWQDEARKVVECEVSSIYFSLDLKLSTDVFQMEKYWKNRPQAPPVVSPTEDATSGNTGSATGTSVLSDYERYHRTLLATTECDGWEAELRRYLKDMPADVSPETDIVEWWQVCHTVFYVTFSLSNLH